MLLSRFLSCFPGEELPVSVLLIDDRFFGVAELIKQIWLIEILSTDLILFV